MIPFAIRALIYERTLQGASVEEILELVSVWHPTMAKSRMRERMRWFLDPTVLYDEKMRYTHGWVLRLLTTDLLFSVLNDIARQNEFCLRRN